MAGQPAGPSSRQRPLPQHRDQGARRQAPDHRGPCPAPVVADERPVPPVMDLAVKKKYCDLIDVNSEYKFQLDQLRNGFLQYAEYNWRFYESKSRFFAKDAFGRNEVLCTHPFAGDKPATIDFTRITKDRSGELVLIVHSFPDAANDGSRIVVKVNNKEFRRSRIRFADGWKAIAVPFNKSMSLWNISRSDGIGNTRSLILSSRNEVIRVPAISPRN